MTLKIRVPKVNLWMIVTIVLAVLLFVSITGWPINLSLTGRFVQLTPDQVKDKAIDFINKNLIKSGSISFVSIEDVGDLYKITTLYQGQEITVHVTKDAKFLILQGLGVIDMTQEIPKPQEQSENPEVPKSDKPEVHGFVMSYCPYGLQFMKAYIPVIELLGEKTDLELNFVDYIMHGEKEMTENTRIYCIQKEQKDKFTNYLRCFVESGDAEKCVADVEIDKAQLETCIQETDDEFEITKTFEESEETFPRYNVDAELSQKYNVRGSPTFVINGQTIQVTRSANAIKEVVCSAFNTPPEECEEELSTTAEKPGLGPIGSGSGSSSTGQC